MTSTPTITVSLQLTHSEFRNLRNMLCVYKHTDRGTPQETETAARIMKVLDDTMTEALAEVKK